LAHGDEARRIAAKHREAASTAVVEEVRTMLLTRVDILAIVVVVDIAIHGQERPVPAQDIAARHDLPGRYLEPMLQRLAASGTLTGKRGPLGGYRLARASHLLTADDIVRAARATENIAAGESRSSIGRRIVIPALNTAQMAFSEALQRITIHDLVRSANRL
jgi:Rrf2 family iron-sulfur cluster assembly transcriptional regulator